MTSPPWPRSLPGPSPWLARVLLIALMLAALFLRLYDLNRTPPGPFYDEAAATLLAGEVACGQSFPVFIPNYTGHEALYYYLTIPLIKLLGVTVLALRLTSALVGTLTVLLAYLLARELFSDESVIEAEWLALFAAALMASSFWHVSVSRYGYRAITLPMLQSLMLLALWRGLRLNSWKWIVAAGVFGGLTAYTYLSSRFVPVALVLIAALCVLNDRSRWRLVLGQWTVLALVALIVFAPLGWFFFTHPGTFFERTTQVSIFERPDWQMTALQNAWRALQVFTLHGDPQISFNLAEQPMFPGILAFVFYLGLIVIAVRLIRASPFGRARYALIVVWPLVMLLPSIFSDPSQIPHSLRSMGIVPFIFFVPALGLQIALGWLQRIQVVKTRQWMTLLATLIFSAVLAGSAFKTFDDYFVRWANLPGLYYQNQGDVADMARQLDALPDDGKPLYVHMLNWYHPTVQVLTRHYERLKWIQGDSVLVLPPAPAVYAWPRDSWPDESWIDRFLPARARVIQTGPDGSPAFMIYSFDEPVAISPTYPLSGTFGGIVEAIGYDVLRDRPSGGRTDVAVYWRVLRKPDQNDLTSLITLSDAWGAEWGHDGSAVYPSSQWSPGEIMAQRVRVQTEDGTPPGDHYTLKLGWWSPSADQHLPRLDSQGQFVGMMMSAGPITITRRVRALDVKAVTIPRRLKADFGNLALLGTSEWPDSLRQGQSEFMTLYWQAVAAPLPNSTVTLQLRPAEGGGQVRVLASGGPVHGTYPTAQWEAGEFIADRMALRVPPDAPPGVYTLEVKVDDGPPLSLARFDVQGIARQWAWPAVSHPMSVTFGSQIALVGYDLKYQMLTPQKNGGQALKSEIEVVLYWQALGAADADYTVFVHVVDENGVMRTQRDDMPVNGTYPTSLWQPGEFVADIYTLVLPPDLPSGRYTLVVGLYNVETGARLLIAGDQDRIALDSISVNR